MPNGARTRGRLGRATTVTVAVTTAILAAAGTATAAPGDLFGPSGGTTYVTPDNPGPFNGTFEKGSGTRRVTERYGAPEGGGTSSLELNTPKSGDSALYATGEVEGPLETFRDSSYWALRGNGSSPDAAPAMNIAVDRNGGEIEPQDLVGLVFIPSSSPAGRWTRYDLGSASFCFIRVSGGVDPYKECRDGAPKRTIDDVLAEFPDATAYAAGVGLGTGTPGASGAADLMRVGDRTYDFERSAPRPEGRASGPLTLPGPGRS
ncbi:hypothetical protein [Pseudonocardia phyllosphaerae]|uniref:hypothetical protein n=1 Tax=Pseudonocardia phyllosphaerae TaxID=3390502 RepID=UPI00397DCAB9